MSAIKRDVTTIIPPKRFDTMTFDLGGSDGSAES
jgi:hypothetical protein